MSLTDRESGCGVENERVGWNALDARELEDARRDSTSDEMRLVSGDGASSSSLSLQPRPVVSPIPPFSRLPSRCRTRRRTVSRSSLYIPFFVMTDPADTAQSTRRSRKLRHANRTITSVQALTE